MGCLLHAKPVPQGLKDLATPQRALYAQPTRTAQPAPVCALCVHLIQGLAAGAVDCFPSAGHYPIPISGATSSFIPRTYKTYNMSTASSTIIQFPQTVTAQVLVVGGGGIGGCRQGGGGGAAALIYAATTFAANTAYTMTIGAGGSGLAYMSTGAPLGNGN